MNAYIRRLVTTLVGAGLVAAAVAGTATAAVADTTTTTTASAVTWPSGVFASRSDNTAGAQAFGTYRGTATSVAVTYADRDSWSDFATNTWGITQHASFPGRLSLAIPLTIGSATLPQVAAGNYDSYFTTWANNVKSLGRGNSFIRIGWEFNGNWMPWSALNATNFVSAFRHISTLVKSVLPSSQIDWNGNWGNSQSGHNPFTELYPGDSYVDVVGLDAYDGNWIPANTDQAFATWQATPFGLQDWLNFATAHGKKFSVPEWGLMPDGSGDNPAFIRGMFNFFTVNSAKIAYESYFNGADNSLNAPVDMPNSSAQYQQLWSQTVTLTPAGTPAPTATNIQVAASTDTWGVNHTFSVTGLPGASTGTVSYTQGSTALCSAAIVNGTATCAGGKALAVGSYPITASYAGDARYLADTSTGTLTVTKRTAAPVLTVSAATIRKGSSVSLSLSGLPGSAAETIQFKSGSTLLCTATPVGGKAHCPTSTTLAVGTYPVVATWSGNSQFFPASASASFSVTT